MVKDAFRILLTAPTTLESKVFEDHGLIDADMLVTGVGSPLTLGVLLDYLYWHPYDIVIQVGFAGTFDKSLPTGMVCPVMSDAFADVAWLKNGKLEPVYKHSSHDYFSWEGWIIPHGVVVEDGVRSVTVHQPTKDEQTIDWLKQNWNPVLETMEGAAFYLACNIRKIPSLQLRVVSNKVGQQQSTWDFATAMKALKHQWLSLVRKYFPHV